MCVGGSDLEEALVNVILCMFNYMTDLHGVKEDASCTRSVEVSGMCSLAFEMTTMACGLNNP